MPRLLFVFTLAFIAVALLFTAINVALEFAIEWSMSGTVLWALAAVAAADIAGDRYGKRKGHSPGSAFIWTATFAMVAILIALQAGILLVLIAIDAEALTLIKDLVLEILPQVVAGGIIILGLFLVMIRFFLVRAIRRGVGASRVSISDTFE